MVEAGRRVHEAPADLTNSSAQKLATASNGKQNGSNKTCVKPEASTNDRQSEQSTTKTKMENLDNDDKTRVAAKGLADFYANKNVLVTGATGFIGKVCLTKLVSALGNCGKIYVLLRPKKGLTPQQRLQKMLNEEPFVTVKKQHEQAQIVVSSDEEKDALAANLKRRGIYQYNHKPLERGSNAQKLDWSKVIAVEGDMSCENLGFEPKIKSTLCKSVEIIFNIAASVQFDAPLKENLRDNYLGARNLLKLATQFKSLISLIHVSTFYTNFHKSHVEERVLPMQYDCEKMAEFISWMPEKICDSIEAKLLEMDARPNTYIFTKAMSENLVQKHEGQLPIAIVRPSIVTPSIRDPVPGWVDNVNGPMGLGVLASLGILRTIDWNYNGVCDFIPVDYVVNSMLVIAERTARLHPKEIKVYNVSSSSLNPLTWGSAFETLRAESIKAPPYKMLRIPIRVPRYKRANKLVYPLTKLSELLFAYIIDFILMLCGQKQLLTKLTLRLHRGYEILKPFTTNEYTCSNDNLVAAFEELVPEDKHEFDFDICKINWGKTFEDSYHGARMRLLREDPTNIPKAQFKMRIHYVFEYGLTAMFYALCAYGIYKFWLNRFSF